MEMAWSVYLMSEKKENVGSVLKRERVYITKKKMKKETEKN